MRYWGLLAAKLIGILVGGVVLRLILVEFFRNFQQVPPTPNDRFATDLAAFLVSFFALIVAARWAVVDQRYRCPRCARRLRMPVQSGSFDKALIFSRPKIEWICGYGHGTMRLPQLKLSSSEPPKWEEHADMWKELELAGKR